MFGTGRGAPKYVGPSTYTQVHLSTPKYTYVHLSMSDSLQVHMAGLRQEQWGRRSLVRALGAWNPAADAVVPEAWVSARSVDAASVTSPDDRQSVWSSVGRLLATDGMALRFSRMGEFDMFAARLLLLGLLTGRRVVMPPIDCSLPWMRKALQARHL